MDTPTSLYEVRLGRGDSSLNRGVPGRPGRRPRSGVSAVSEARLTWSRRDSRDSRQVPSENNFSEQVK